MSSLLEARQTSQLIVSRDQCSPLIEPYIRHIGDARMKALTVLALSGVDETTHAHSLRVEEVCVLLTQELIEDEDERDAASTFALTHDVGKLCVYDLINLERRFNPGELKRMQRHPDVGAKFILSVGLDCLESEDFPLGSPFAEKVTLYAAAIARGHHGPAIYGDKGYPSPEIDANKDPWLKEQIGELLHNPIVHQQCVVVAAADNFDAFAHKRLYSKDRLLHEIGRSSVDGLDEILTMIEGNFRGLATQERMRVLTALEKVGGMILDRRAVEAEHSLNEENTRRWDAAPTQHKRIIRFPRFLRPDLLNQTDTQEVASDVDPRYPFDFREQSALGTV